ncbi:MAG: mechanosensitive ion channel family protein [Rhizobiaceae bacterium]|nr:MAG: mechanosensitive ion channel family protein [Rhizobiaceae bacterium]
MDATTSKLMIAAQTGVHEAGTILVNYSFSTLGAIVLLILGYIAASLAERWCFAGLGHVRGFDQTLRLFLSKVLRYTILIFAGVIVLAQFGVQTASIIAALGAAGIAIGLALQGTLQNIAAGIMLLVLRPFIVGEYVSVGNIAGTIKEIGLFATELKTSDGLYVMAPNSQLWGSAVTNYSRNKTRLNDLAIGVAYDDDIDLALKLLLKLADDKRVLEDPAPLAFVSELQNNGATVTLRYWTQASDWWQTKLDLTRLARVRFDENGFTAPLPQSSIRLVEKTPPQSTPPKS